MSSLRHLALFVTESCNLACDYCYAADAQERQAGDAAPWQAMDLLFAPENDAQRVTVTFWGGEPLLRFGLVRRLVEHAESLAARRDKRVDFAIPTNLTLLTEEMIDFFVEHRVRLSLSLDGREAAQSLRRTRGGRSSFPIVARKLEMVHRRFGERLPGVRMTVSPPTAPDFYGNVRFFLDQGFRQVYFSPVSETEWSPDDLSRFEEGQRDLVAYWLDRLDRGAPPRFNSWDKVLARREFRRRGRIDRGEHVSCGAGCRMLAVDIHGDIYPCHRFVFYDKAARRGALGRVADGWPDPERTRPYADLGAGRVRTPPERCRNCEATEDCHQVCPALNYALSGDIAGVHERLCHFTRMEKRVIDHLESSATGRPGFQEYLASLYKLYAPDAVSASMAAFFATFDEEQAERLADRAHGILGRLQGERAPGERS